MTEEIPHDHDLVARQKEPGPMCRHVRQINYGEILWHTGDGILWQIRTRNQRMTSMGSQLPLDIRVDHVIVIAY